MIQRHNKKQGEQEERQHRSNHLNKNEGNMNWRIFPTEAGVTQIPRQSDDARNRRAREPTFLRSGASVYPKNRDVSCKSWHSNRIHDVAVPMRSANSDLQTTIRIAASLLYSALLRSALLYSALLLPLLFFSLVFSTLPLLYLYSTSPLLPPGV